MADLNTEKPITFKSWAVLVLLSIVWGSSFILIKKALIVFDPVNVAALRVGITCLAFIPVLILQWSEIDWSQWKYFLLVGTTGSALPALLFATAQTHVSSSVAGVLNSLTPVFTLILGYLFFKTPFYNIQTLGIVVGFIGASLLILGDQNADLGGNIMYGSLIVIATLCYGYNTNGVKFFFKNTKPLIISAVSFSLLGPLTLSYLAFGNFRNQLTSHEYGFYALGAVAILAIMGTVFSTVIFFKLIKDTNPVFGASVSYLIPIVALFWGLWDGESIYLLQYAGICAVLFGIYLLKRS